MPTFTIVWRFISEGTGSPIIVLVAGCRPAVQVTFSPLPPLQIAVEANTMILMDIEKQRPTEIEEVATSSKGRPPCPPTCRRSRLRLAAVHCLVFTAFLMLTRAATNKNLFVQGPQSWLFSPSKEVFPFPRHSLSIKEREELYL